MNELESPVAMFVFNRPETTRRVFAAIASVRPKRLLLIADGPRKDHQGEAERCEEVKRIVTSVNWPCHVETNFSVENMGCRRRMISGLNWVFSRVDEAIILEDDCLPDPSFFPFCAEMLARYRHQTQISCISGFNPIAEYFSFPYSYFYSLMSGIWGWATWRRAWCEYDETLGSWPELKRTKLLKLVFRKSKAIAYWSRIFDQMYRGTGPDTWDYQWNYTRWTRNWLSIIPKQNLVQNIGFGADATHTKGPNPHANLRPGAAHFPLLHPPAIMAWPEHVMHMQERVYTPNLVLRVRRRLVSLLQSAGGSASS